ncbi:MAG: DUF488 domain-containing protein [Micavibrio sp.]
MAQTIYTIGHSTHPIDEFIAMLKAAGVNTLVDVRSVPRSRTNPQFNKDSLPDALAGTGISYVHIQALGGLRSHPKNAPPSKNTFWDNKSFRNYADYAETDIFRDGLDQLKTLSADHVCAIMCAEAVWWHCHRRIITDYLLADGFPVVHIMGVNKTEPAKMNPGARIQPDGTILYPPETLELGL